MAHDSEAQPEPQMSSAAPRHWQGRLGFRVHIRPANGWGRLVASSRAALSRDLPFRAFFVFFVVQSRLFAA
jgi:hypothetical protein